jgi:ABC-type ATPase with predicted acetyltransferase domain
LSTKDITGYLSSVGFSSPPSWLRPFRVLSNGEQFRATLARALADERELVVIDEFTSVVDRTVAQIGSAALSKAIRRKDKKFIAVSVHYDILDWLEPDWVYQPHTGEYYTGRYLHQRPEIKLEVKRVHHTAWANIPAVSLFRHRLEYGGSLLLRFL